MPRLSRTLVALLGACLGAVRAASGHPDSIDVVVVLSQDLAPYRSALAGIQSDPGLRITVLDLKGDVKEGAWIVRKVRTLKPEAVVSMGSLATVILSREITDIPMVFTMTTETPEEVKSAANVTGVYLNVSPALQIEALKQVLPGVGSIGVVYDASRSAGLVAEADRKARSLGLTFQARQVQDGRDVPAALRDLAGLVDALWMIPDSTCFTRESFEFALKLSLEKRAPLMVFSEAYVRAGALMALSPDYERVGSQTARLVRRVHAGEHPSSLPPRGPEDPMLVINRRTASNLGASIAPEKLATAERVFP